MSSNAEGTRCKGVTKRGNPCGAAATASGLCFFHSNPGKASELGRIGGRKNRHAVVGVLDPLPILGDEFAVRDAVSRVAADLYAGRIPAKNAASLALLMSLQLRVFGAVDEAEKMSQYSPYRWRKASSKTENSDVRNAENSTVPKSVVSNVGRPENSSSVAPEVLSVRESENPRAGKSEISNAVNSRISNGGRPEMSKAVDPEISKVRETDTSKMGWPELAKLGEPEISSEKDPEISSAAKATISREGKLEVLSAGSPDPPIRNYPALPDEKMLALKRERARAEERELSIELAMASSLSDGFGFDES
jgi:hypothetical protein